MSTAFAAAGHDVLLIGVAGSTPARLDIETRLFTHPGRREGLAREVQKVAFNEVVADAARAELEAFAPDVLYERLSLFADCGLRLARSLGVDHVVEVNALLAREEAQWRGLRLGGLAHQREAAVLGGCTLAIAVSDEWAGAVNDVAPSTPVAVVPNGVDIDLFAAPVDRDEARRSFGLPTDAAIVGFAGALRPWHGLDAAIRALRLLPDDVVLAVAGDGPVRSDLEALAVAENVESRVRWLGQLEHRAVPRFLASLDVAVAPYPALDDFAFSPLKLYEYLAGGVPTVASDIGQVGRAMHPDGGLLVRPGEVPALAAGIRRVLNDPARWRRRAAVARAHALANHSWLARARDIVGHIERTGSRAVA
ncbi:MAG: glycosyltransferase family 4 protein [Acidimicrobiia bacterium]